MRLTKTMSILLSAVMVLLMLPCNVFAADSVAINSTNFPDEVFRKFVKDNFDTNGNGKLGSGEISNVKVIDFGTLEMGLPIGIKYFTALEELYSMEATLGYNFQVFTLDLSGLKNLRILKIGGKQKIYGLDLTNCNSLEEIVCDGCRLDTNITLSSAAKKTLKKLTVKNNTYYNEELKKFSVKGFTALEELDISGSRFTSINITGCTSLKSINMSGDKQIASYSLSDNTTLETLDFSNCTNLTNVSLTNCTALKKVIGESSAVTDLDCSGCTSLAKISMNSSGLKNINIDGCDNLESLYVSETKITELNIGDRPKLNYLSSRDNSNLTSLVLGNCPALTKLYFYNTNVKSIDLSKCPKLEILYCYSTPITSLSVKHLSNLKELCCYKCTSLKSIDVSGLSKLEGLKFYRCNGISSVDVSGCSSLVEFSGGQNALTSIDLSDCKKLEIAYVWGNRLTELDLSENPDLVLLEAEKNDFTELDVSNHTKLSTFLFYDNPLVELNASGCSSLEGSLYFVNSDGSNTLKRVNFNGCSKITEFTCEEGSLLDIKLTGCSSLNYLYLYDNKLNKLDLTDCTELIELDCSINNIQTLLLPQTDSLKYLGCYDNNLSELDVTQYADLEYLSCVSNDIETLYIAQTPLVDAYENPTKQDTRTYNGKVYVDFVGDNSELIVDAATNIDIVTTPTPTAAPTPTDVPGGNGGNGNNSGSGNNGSSGNTTPGNNSGNGSTGGNGGSGSGTGNNPTAPTTPIPTAAPAPTLAPSELNVGDFVRRCYQVALQREAEAEGFEYWVSKLNNGEACGAQVGFGFIFSGEYMNRNRNDDEFVRDLYSMYFDREPDQGGYDYWMGLLAAGSSREDVFAGFANSQEFYNLCLKYGVTQGYYVTHMDLTQQGGVNCFVARLYKVCLNRLPDMGGQSGWVVKLINGEVTGTTAAYGFIMSPEFTNLGLNDVDYVAYMYRAFFGREAAKEEIDGWVMNMAGGLSREDVFNGFSGSLEFANLCASYGINA